VKKDILRLGFSLAVFAAAACVALALVYTVTAPTIAGHEAEQLQVALKDLFPDADKFPEIEAGLVSADPGVTLDKAYVAVRGNATLGVAIKATGKSYGGAASLLVGVSTDRRIAGARILILADTPGLGANAQSPSYFVDKSSKTTFMDQFTGKIISDRYEVKNDVIAITASTITSKALTNIVKKAGDAGSTWLEANPAGGAQ
jgi:electron transport complex protein RnfG